MALWTPAALPTELWLDASDAASLTMSGSLVDGWRSKSAVDTDLLSTSGNEPLKLNSNLNGLDVIQFDGSSEYVEAADPPGLLRDVSDASVFVVHKWPSNVTSVKYHINIAADDAFYTRLATGAGINARKSFISGDPVNSAAGNVSEGSNHGTSWQILGGVFIYSAGDLLIYRDGTLEDSNLSAFTSENSADTDPEAVSVGRRFYSGGSGYANTTIAEIVVISNDTSDATREKIEGYLAWKWGLEGDLPVGHTYENAAPELDVEAIAEVPGVLGAPEVLTQNYTDIFGAHAAASGPLGIPAALAGATNGFILLPGVLEAFSFPSALSQHDPGELVPIGSQNQYVADIIGPGGTIRIPIDTWQASLRADLANQLRCTIPAVGDLKADILAATDFEIYRVGGGVPDIYMVGSWLDSANFTRNALQHSCILEGFQQKFFSDPDPDPFFDRQLTGIRQIENTAQIRVTCNIDFAIKPGQRAFAGDQEILVSFVNYVVSPRDSYMRIGEAN